MKTILQSALMLSMALMVMTFMGCKEDDPPATSLSGISPTNGPKGTKVTIKGVSFGADAAVVKVFFNEIESVNVTLVSDTEITATVPAGSFTGDVVVKIAEKELAGGEFTYELSEAIVSTLAGSGDFGADDGLGAAATFSGSYNLAADADGNIYVADNRSSAIRKITPGGMVTTLVQDDALLSRPWGIVVDQNNGDVYAGSRNWDLITKTTQAGVITPFAGGRAGYINGQQAGEGEDNSFNNPFGMVLDADGNLYVADASNNAIRKITPGGLASTFAGSLPNPENDKNAGDKGYADGTGTDARFNYPSGIDMDEDGNFYVCDKSNHAIRKITPAGVVTTIAGAAPVDGAGTAGYADGTGSVVMFDSPWQLDIAADGNIYVHDQSNSRVRMVTTDGVTTTFAGTGVAGADNGPAATATFFGESGFAPGLTTFGFDIYVTGNNQVRKIFQD